VNVDLSENSVVRDGRDVRAAYRHPGPNFHFIARRRAEESASVRIGEVALCN
jgi:hypothetical protein